MINCIYAAFICTPFGLDGTCTYIDTKARKYYTRQVMNLLEEEKEKEEEEEEEEEEVSMIKS